EHRLYADCLDGFAGLDITGIVFRREKRRHIEVIELFERHRQELEAIVVLEFRQEFVWLAGAMQQCRDLSGLHFLKCDGIVDIERLPLHPETLEKDWARYRCSGALCVKAHLLTFQIVEGIDLGAHKYMEL